MTTKPDRTEGDGLQTARDIVTAYFDSHGINDARAAGFNIVERLCEAGLTLATSDAAEGAKKPVARDNNMFSRLANEPLAVIPDGHSAPLDIRTAAEIEHDRLARKAAPPQPAPDAMWDDFASDDWFSEHRPKASINIEDGARAIARCRGHDPDDLAPRTEMCTWDNEQVPWWKVFEEEAEACLSAWAALAAPVPSPDGALSAKQAMAIGSSIAEKHKAAVLELLSLTTEGKVPLWSSFDKALHGNLVWLASEIMVALQASPSSAGAAEPQSSLDPIAPWEAELEAMAAEPDAVLDDDPPMKWLIERLRGLAIELVADPKTPWIGERDPKQHTCWLAADRLSAPAVGVTREAIAKIVCCRDKCILEGCDPGCIACSPEHPLALETADLILAALRSPAPDATVSATPQQVQEACAQVADRAVASDEASAIKYPDEREKFEQRAHRGKTIATAIRALIPPAPQDVGRDATIDPDALNDKRAHDDMRLASNVREAVIKECSNIALAIDSGRGNEKEIAKAILALSRKGGGQ